MIPSECSFFSETKITDWLQLISVPISIYLAYLGLKNERKNSFNSFLIIELQNWTKSFDLLTENFVQYYTNAPDESLRISILTQVKLLSRSLHGLLELFDDNSHVEVKNAWLDYRSYLTGNEFDDKRRISENKVVLNDLEILSKKIHLKTSKSIKKLS